MTISKSVAESIGRSVAKTVLDELGLGGVSLDPVVTAYRDAINAARTGADLSDGDVTALNTFYTSLSDFSANIRLIAFLDSTYGVGEGTTVIPMIADDGSGNAVDASDANQEDGTLVGGAHWGAFQTTSQYAQLPFPQAGFDYETYSLCATMDAGASSGVNTLLSVEVTGELVTTGNTSEWRWFSSDRFDGFGTSNLWPAHDTSQYQFQRMGFVRENLTEFRSHRNGYDRYATRANTSASTPDYIWVGHQVSLPGRPKPFGCILFDSALSQDELVTVLDAMETLRGASIAGSGELLLTQGGADSLLTDGGTSDILLTEASA